MQPCIAGLSSQVRTCCMVAAIYDLKVDYFQQRIALYLCRNPGCELVGCRLMGFFDRSLQYLIYKGPPSGDPYRAGCCATKAPARPLRARSGRDDLDRNAQLAYHFADYRDLLEVLLAEIGFGRFHQIEKPTHDLCHAVEVAGSGRTSITLSIMPKSNVRVSGSGYTSSTEGMKT